MPSQIRSSVELIVFDFDGVLTDNRVLVFDDGREAVMCNRADGLGFDCLRAAGIPTLIMSTERSPVVSARAAKLRVPVLQAVRDKGEALMSHCSTHGIDRERVMYVGNDVNDLPAMRLVGHRIAVADSNPAVMAIATHVIAARGGEGVAREIAEVLLGLDTETYHLQAQDHG